MSATLPGL